MGFRFNKRIKLCKGISLNIGKNGITPSVKIGNVSLNTKGRTTLSVPKTGISFSTNVKSKSNKSFWKRLFGFK
jgi:hypothetical protein